MANAAPKNIYGILGPSPICPVTFEKLREHRWVKSAPPWPGSNDIPDIPDDAIDALGGDGSAYWRDVQNARGLFRTGWRFYVANVREAKTIELAQRLVPYKFKFAVKKSISTQELARWSRSAGRIVESCTANGLAPLLPPLILALAKASTAAERRNAFFGMCPSPVSRQRRRGPRAKSWPDAFLEFLELFRMEAGSSQSDRAFARAVAGLVQYLPEDLAPAKVPKHLRTPFSASAIGFRRRDMKRSRR